jgi:hypothetical protein
VAQQIHERRRDLGFRNRGKRTLIDQSLGRKRKGTEIRLPDDLRRGNFLNSLHEVKSVHFGHEQISNDYVDGALLQQS